MHLINFVLGGKKEHLLLIYFVAWLCELALRSQAVTFQIKIHSTSDIMQRLQSLWDRPGGSDYYWLELGDKAGVILRRVVEKVIRIKGPNQILII